MNRINMLCLALLSTLVLCGGIAKAEDITQRKRMVSYISYDSAKPQVGEPNGSIAPLHTQTVEWSLVSTTSDNAKGVR